MTKIKIITAAFSTIVFTVLFCSCSDSGTIHKLTNKIDSLTVELDTIVANNKRLKDQLEFEELPDSYGVELLQTGGIGSRQVQVQAFYLTEHGYFQEPEKWVRYFFNNPGDNLNITPIPGYYIREIHRVDNNGNSERINCDEFDFCQVRIYDVLQNKFSVIMVQSGYDEYIKEKDN